MKAKVAVIMGSKTDYKVMKDAEHALKEFKIPFTMKIVSAHRGPEDMMAFAMNAHVNGFSVIIAGAGGAAHLPGMVASLTPLPVIGVPITIGKLKGWDALMSIQQMPKGVPVATVAIDNAYNAGVLAARILGVHSHQISQQLQNFRNKNKALVKKMNRELR